MLTFKSF